ncbi:hypothetical protein IBX38_00385 [Candidatus Bathyarchaeota archaeon]|nr:hypothetical protein [Candidatus Bathyarchaeota archaeon]
MARDRKMRICPSCGKPMKKHAKKAEYVCRNPRCPVIFVRVHRGMKRIGVEARLNEKG